MDADAIAQKRAARAAKKAQAGAAGTPVPPADHLIRKREWVPVRDAPDGGRRVRVVSWNMLAQCLVRRELFPGSDCLKNKDRFPGLAAELRAYDWDIGCFQEVDCIKEHADTLGKAGYAYHYERGYDNKLHGLMIAWRCSGDRPSFKYPVYKRVVYYDDARPLEIAARARGAPLDERGVPQADAYFAPDSAVGAEGAPHSATAVSRLTRNIACIVALPFAEGGGGVIVATTHLFWHPKYAYERVRQAAILMQELEAFRSDPEHADVASWPAILAGDLNDQPHSPTYTLLTGQGRTYVDELAQALGESRIVHTSVDEVRGMRSANYAVTVTEAGDEDRVLGRYRPPAKSELLTLEQILRMYELPAADGVGAMQSVYAAAHPRLVTDESKTFFSVRTPSHAATRHALGTLRYRENAGADRPPPAAERRADVDDVLVALSPHARYVYFLTQTISSLHRCATHATTTRRSRRSCACTPRTRCSRACRAKASAARIM